VRKGAFQAGYSSNFHGKIIYSKCRKPVYTPSDWDPALAERSADLPDARLVLQYIYGYQGEGRALLRVWTPTALHWCCVGEGLCIAMWVS